jgi:septum formation protein
MRLVLASQSPRRADLLRAAGFEFDVCAADVDESVRPKESPAEYVQRLASAKSAAALASLISKAGINEDAGLKVCAPENGTVTGVVAQAFRPARQIIVIGADTAVVVDRTILGKPADDEEAAAMLRQLSGRSHEVMTGLSIRSSTDELRHVETTVVHFGALSGDQIAWYVQSGEGRDKAGGYAIQGLAARFIPRVEGSYSNVVGLPVAALATLIHELEGGRTT